LIQKNSNLKSENVVLTHDNCGYVPKRNRYCAVPDTIHPNAAPLLCGTAALPPNLGEAVLLSSLVKNTQEKLARLCSKEEAQIAKRRKRNRLSKKSESEFGN
jgi:hypothetical protein